MTKRERKEIERCRRRREREAGSGARGDCAGDGARRNDNTTEGRFRVRALLPTLPYSPGLRKYHSKGGQLEGTGYSVIDATF